jgi:iron complex outermembrane receptor protein
VADLDQGRRPGRQFQTDQILYQRTTRLNCRNDASSGAIGRGGVPCATITGIVDANSVTNDIPFFKTGDLGYSGGIRYWNDNTMATYAATLAAAGKVNDVHAVNPNPNTASQVRRPRHLPGLPRHLVGRGEDQERLRPGQFRLLEPARADQRHAGRAGGRHQDHLDRLQPRPDRARGRPIVNFVQASQDGGYTKTLPSLNLRFEFIPNTLIGRVAASKVMARAAPSQLALRRSIDVRSA